MCVALNVGVSVGVGCLYREIGVDGVVLLVRCWKITCKSVNVIVPVLETFNHVNSKSLSLLCNCDVKRSLLVM